MRRVLLLAALAACSGKKSPNGPGPASPPDAAGEASEEERLAAIELAMNQLGPAAHLCWAAAATDDYRLAGEVRLLIEVGADGAARATIQEDSTRDAVLAACLVAIAEGFAWPPPMHGQATLLPFAFTAPVGQYVIDRQLIPDREVGARVLLDGKNSGNRTASVFELVVPEGESVRATASERAEIWFDLAAQTVRYLPPRAERKPGPGRYLIVAVPGGDEGATRDSGVLPASPSSADKTRPKPVDGGAGQVIERPGVGIVTLMIDPSKVKGAELSASILEIVEGAAIPLHVHDGSTELLYVISGEGTMTVDGVELPITSSSVVQIPAGLEHGFTATAPTRALQLYAPPGPEQRFKAK
jgi:mannose-6-phosphate isomerase-like protein (cupin superfamily)